MGSRIEQVTWILVTERLPDKLGTYLVETSNGFFRHAPLSEIVSDLEPSRRGESPSIIAWAEGLRGSQFLAEKNQQASLPKGTGE